VPTDHSDLIGPDEPTEVRVVNQDFNVSIDGQTQALRVKVVEFDMTFWRLVLFLVKVSMASLPAVFIIVLASTIFTAFFGALLFAR
jgi:hypothetical protein